MGHAWRAPEDPESREPEIFAIARGLPVRSARFWLDAYRIVSPYAADPAATSVRDAGKASMAAAARK
jgi:hypothetical protein